MRLLDISDLYNLISRGTESIDSRKQSMSLRKNALESCSSKEGFKKLAFDTRRVNQETDYIPRRGLQNYHRSEKFVSDAIAMKIQSFSKLAAVLDQLKIEYGREPEWQDSYTRVLGEAVNKGLRTDQSDGDFSDAQPSMASLDYLEELMFVRYRLTSESIMNMSEEELRKNILGKDELLVRQGISKPPLEITPSDVTKNSYEDMMKKMMTTMSQMMSSYNLVKTNEKVDVKTTKETPEEKTVTITIKV